MLKLTQPYEISEFLSKSPSSVNTGLENFSTSRISDAEQQLASNILVLKDGGITSAVQLKPLPNDFLDSWNKVNSHWTDFKSTINNQIYNNKFALENIKINTSVNQTVGTNLDNSIKEELISKAFNLVNSSDALVTQIGQKVESNWDELIILQIIFGVLIVILILFILIMIRRLLRPISLLTRATSEIKKGNLEVSVDHKGGNELSELIESFNSMVSTIKNDVKKQSEMTDQLTQLNIQLKDNDRTKKEFISMISHELRTPLVPIKGYTELLLKTQKFGELNEKQTKAIQIIHRNEKKLESLVENILDIYKFDMGIINLNRKEIPILQLFDNVINDLKTEIEKKHATMVTEINTAVKKIVCDEKRIEQVLSNLIKNSLDFIPNKSGKIILKVEELKEADKIQIPGNNHLIFSVEDNGSGIKADKIDKLFHKFYQIDTTLAREYGGTGLGLVICRDIIEAHGGKLWIDRDYTDGAAFRFTIPF